MILAFLCSEDPLFLEPYWQQHASTSSIVSPGWQCMRSRTMGGDFISAELDRHVRLLHKAAENAITDGKFILFGSEVGELLHALVHALSAVNASSSPACLVASAPHNPVSILQISTAYLASNTFISTHISQPIRKCNLLSMNNTVTTQS